MSLSYDKKDRESGGVEMANTPYRRRRTNYVINKSFQFRFVAFFLILVVLAFLVFSAGFAGFYWIRYMAGDNIFSEFIYIQRQVRVKSESGEEVLKSEMLPPINRIELILPPLLINNLVIMVIIAIIGVFFSHRIAGPIYRIEQDISRIISGERNVKIRIRKRDALDSLVHKINQLIMMIEGQGQQERQDQQDQQEQ
jgi:methyl-accepting chemotaxis protein